MKQQYVIRPETVEVHSLGDKTDIILRKDIVEVERTEEGAEDSVTYAAFECEEKQLRYAGTVTKEEVTTDFDSWWNYEKPVAEPKATVEERLTSIQAAQEAQDEVLAEILLSTLSVDTAE